MFVNVLAMTTKIKWIIVVMVINNDEFTLLIGDYKTHISIVL